MTSNYSVPIIPQNLGQHETIVQIAEVINHLSNITEDLFVRVNKRLESNKSKLQQISSRVNLVNDKVQKLKGSKNATQVFSCCKYPASEINRDYVSIFNVPSTVTLERHKVKPKLASTAYEPIGKLQFYHVKDNSKYNFNKLEGLGDAPEDIACLNDLLLYNTGKNIYKNFIVTDALKGPDNVTEEDNLEVSAIGPAPHSISENLNNSTPSLGQNYFYTPQIGNVPVLDVPLDLPDLPGIADNVQYESDAGPGIAPSALVINSLLDNIADLPKLPQIEEENNPDISQISLPPPPPPVVELPKPPPLVTEFPLQNDIPPEPTKKKIEVDSPKIKAEERKIEKPVKESPLVENNPHSSLMEAIRQAGGSNKARLRSVKETAKDNKAAPGGDLMADLHSKLLMRRKGIAGKKPEQEAVIDSDSTFRKIKDMIPLPEPKTDIESTSNDEEDWE